MAAAKPTNRRTVILVAVLAVLALIAFYVNFLSGGGGSGGGTAAPPATTVTQPAPAATTTTTAPGAPAVPGGGAFDVFATRDPFQPAATVDTGSAPADTGGSATTMPTTAAAATGAATTPTTSAAQNPTTGTSVVLVDVFTSGSTTQARIQVGSTVYTVSAGQTFATSYKVVSLSGTCGQFLYGDSPFSLCKGEEVIK